MGSHVGTETRLRALETANGSSQLYLEFVALEVRAVQFCNDGIGMFFGNIGEKMTISNVNRSDNFSR